jgi:hypothetical protein
VSDGRFIATSEYGCGLRRMHRMLQGHSDSGPGATSRAAAYRIHHHQHGSVSRLKKSVDIGRRSGFFDAVLSEICPHGGDEVLGVCHDLILTAPDSNSA